MNIVKSFYAAIILTTVIITFNSCCKMECEENSVTISFENYKLSEIDTLVFLSFNVNTNFSVVKDSTSYIIQNVANDTSRATHAHNIYSNKDWIIKVPSVNKEFRISNYDMATASCSCGNKNYNIVRSFTVNGVRETSSSYYKLPR